jgi:hypothetical protein
LTGIVMYDSAYDDQFPAGAAAYAAYVDGGVGDQPNYDWIVQAFPGAHHLSIALFADKDADALDVEPGAAVPSDIPGWYARQRRRGIARPCIYASASTMQASVIPAIRSVPVIRSSVRLWTAHFGEGEHICGPGKGTCGQLAFDADGTQWTPNAMGLVLDQSLLLPDFFGTPVVPPLTYTEIDMSRIAVLKQGDSGQPVRDWQGLLVAHGYGSAIAPDPGTTVEAAAGVDGDYGPKTEAATRLFRSAKGLPAAGGADAKAWAAALGVAPAS